MLAGVMEKKPKKKVEMTVQVEEKTADDPSGPSPTGGGTTPKEQLMEFFNEIDADGSGFLDRGEVKDLAEKLGVEMTKRELDEAMAEMDEDGSGEVDFDEFSLWWPKQQGKNSKLVAAMNDRWSAALDRVKARRQAEAEATETQRALEAVAKSHGKMVSAINEADEKNKVLLNKIAALQTQLKEEHAARMSDNEAADGAAADYEAQIKALLNKLSEMERLQARTESSLESEQAQREQDVRTLSTAQEELSTKMGLKQLRSEALVGQIEGLNAMMERLKQMNRNERNRSAQVQADFDATTDRLTRQMQLEVGRREEQITRLLSTLERLREQEAVLLEQLREAVSKKDAYKAELKELREMVKAASRAGAVAKAQADEQTAFTVIR